MKISTYYMEQRSPEWYAIRKGLLTASEVDSWLTEEPEFRLTIPQIKEKLDADGIEYRKSAKRDELVKLLDPAFIEANKGYSSTSMEKLNKVLLKKVAQDLGCVEAPNVPNFWMQRGIDLELEAKEVFQEHSGLTVEEVGFIKIDGILAGCSPDGLIGDDALLEIKVPAPETHLQYLLDGVLPERYKLQVHMQLAITQRKRCHFWSYNETKGVSPLHVVVERDYFTEKVLNGLIRFDKEYKKTLSKVLSK